MNIAEIRKKKKKLKEKTKEEVVIEKEKVEEPYLNTTLPVPQNQETLPKVTLTTDENIGFIDEDAFYATINRAIEVKEQKEFLCFLLGDEEYAIGIELTREVLKYREITEVPKTSEIILGIVAIRGEMIPVFDIGKLLGLEEKLCDLKGKKLILLNINGESLCILVDRITMIRKIVEDAIEPPPMNLNLTKQEFISGVALIDGKMVRILNIENMLSY